MHRTNFLVEVIQNILLRNIILECCVSLPVQHFVQSLRLLLHTLAPASPSRSDDRCHRRLLLFLLLPCLGRLPSLAHAQPYRHRKQLAILLPDSRPDLGLSKDFVALHGDSTLESHLCCLLSNEIFIFGDTSMIIKRY